MAGQEKFNIRNATHQDMPQLLELEKEWPEDLRASEAELALRLDKFADGFFVASDNTGMIASIIAHPYFYSPDNLSNFQTWSHIVNTCYRQGVSVADANALYIISGTTRKTPYVTELFNAGIELVVNLARKLDKRYVVGGALLPGFAKFKQQHVEYSARDYAFRMSQGRHIDPLLEKYRRIGFRVPDKNHVVENYFPDNNSLGFSALVVKDLYGAD